MNRYNLLKMLGTLLFFLLLLLIFNIINKSESNKSYNNSEPIQIVYITDDNYVTYMRTSIRSVIANKNNNTKLIFYILGYNLSADNIKNIKKEECKNVEIKLIEVPTELLNKFNGGTKINPFVTKVDNAKFFLPSLLEDINKILYFDGDTVILRDLSNVYHTDLTDIYVGAVDDWQTDWNDNSEKRYFNNGVMLLNLQKMRKDNIETQLINYKLFDKKNRFVTQDAYNTVMYGKVLYLPLIYDTFAPEFDNSDSIMNRVKKTLRKNYKPELYPYRNGKDYQKNVAIIHYCGYGNLKPWQGINLKSKSNRIWYRYAPLDFWFDCMKGKCKTPSYMK